MEDQFIAGIANESKLDMLKHCLASEKEITFPLAKVAVIKAYSRIGRASPFNAVAGQPTPAKQEMRKLK